MHNLKNPRTIEVLSISEELLYFHNPGNTINANWIPNIIKV